MDTDHDHHGAETVDTDNVDIPPGPVSSAALFLVERARRAHQRRRRVRVLVHRAFLLSEQPPPECFFVNVTNLGQRDVEVTHLWFDTKPPVYVLHAQRPLPVRLKPDQPWEAWVPLSDIPAGPERAMTLARVRLSNGKVIKSRPNRGVPDAGFVPGAGAYRG